jgi:glutamine synthetase
VTAFSNYGVLSERELHSRYEVFLEQYVAKLNIEAETAASIARTMLLPAAVRYKAELLAAEEPELVSEIGELISSFLEAIRALESANLKENHPEDEGPLVHAGYMHDTVFPAMAEVRDIADTLERIVADDLWPLPKYSEILFIK